MFWDNSFYKQPLFHEFAQFSKEISYFECWPTLDEYNALLQSHQPILKNANNKAVKFVSQGEKPVGFEDYYEPRSYLKGEVQTRLASWHDFFNACIWIMYPKLKIIVNQIHYEQVCVQRSLGLGARRNRCQNRLTHFDECGVVVCSEDIELIDMLKAHQWLEVFWHRREQVKQKMSFHIFGHGLYEKALTPYIGLTGHAFYLHVDRLPAVPDALAAKVLPGLLHGEESPLYPLPILGIPGWWPENCEKKFYLNKQYFR